MSETPHKTTPTPLPRLDRAALAILARQSRWVFLWAYARHYKLYWALGLISLMGTSLFAALIPWTVKACIEGLEGPDPVAVVPPLALCLGGYALAQALCRVGSRTIVYWAGREIEFEIRNDLFAHILGLPMSFYDRTPSGQVLSRAANDTSDIRMTLGAGFIQLLNTFFAVGSSLAMMVWLSPRLAAYTAAMSPILALCFRYLTRRNYASSRRVQEGLADMCAKVTENLTGLATVQAHGQEAREIAEFERRDLEYRTNTITLARYRAITWPIAGIVSGFSMIILIVLGGPMVIHGELTLGAFVAFQGYVAMLQWPMIGFGWILNVIQRGFAAIDRLQQLLAIETDVPEPNAAKAVPADLGPGLEIRDLHFRFPQRGLDDLTNEGGSSPPNPEILRGVNLTVRPGERLALVGKIGAGKSTLVDLLVRLYPVPEGSIHIGGVDLNEVSLGELRGMVGFVPQDRFLFSRTLLENLGMGDTAASSEEIEGFARMAQLDKDVQDFPDGYQTILGERGVTLSGGQRQRACLTRALARKPRLLVLDDTFSAVDTDTEEAILSALRHRDPAAVTVMITHRPSTMREADRICVLDEGQVAQEGSHGELMAVPGLYRNLVETATLREELGLDAAGEGT